MGKDATASDAEIDELLRLLNSLIPAADVAEYGLPLHSEAWKQLARMMVRAWLRA